MNEITIPLEAYVLFWVLIGVGVLVVLALLGVAIAFWQTRTILDEAVLRIEALEEQEKS